MSRLSRTAVTSLRDLTEGQRAETELDLFFNLSTDLLVIVVGGGRLKRVNPAFEKAMGYSEAELPPSMFEFMHPDDREGKQAAFLGLIERGEGSMSCVSRFLRKDAKVVWLAWNAVVSNGLLYCVGRDVSEETRARADAEDQHSWLRELMDTIPIPMALIESGTGAVISVSGMIERIFPVFPVSMRDMAVSPVFCTDLEGRRLPEEMWPRVRAARGEELENEPVTWHTPEGNIHLLVSSRNIAKKYSRPSVSLMVAQDVTHLVRAEDSLRETVDLLAQEQDMRDRFISALTHDLRTPLTTMKMAAQLAQVLGDEPATLRKCTERIISSIDRAEGMIRDLLDASQIKAGQPLVLKPADCHLNTLVQSTLDELIVAFGDRFCLEASEQIHGYWDSRALQRALENLANNAVKYGMPASRITLRLVCFQEQVRISVHNLGNPIAPGDQAKIFDPFKRTESSRKSKQLGWGIGLALVQGIAKAHGGSVEVESSLEQGTTFTVQIPRVFKSVQ